MTYTNKSLLTDIKTEYVFEEFTLQKITNEKPFTVYVNDILWESFDTVTIYNKSLNFYKEMSTKYPTFNDLDITVQQAIRIPFDNCFNMTLKFEDGKEVKLEDCKTTKTHCKIRKDILDTGDFVRLKYYKKNEGYFTGTAYIASNDGFELIMYVGNEEEAKSIHVYGWELLDYKIRLEIEILHKAEHIEHNLYGNF